MTKDERLARLLEICLALPEAEVVNPGGEHRTLIVRNKKFAYYLDDHHGDGIIAICGKTSFVEQAELVATEPDRYYMPSYIGPRSWVALRLDAPEVDWDEVAGLVTASYRLVAPKRLAALV
jgi:phosphoribosylglycinamide formyltransferase-1